MFEYEEGEDDLGLDAAVDEALAGSEGGEGGDEPAEAAAPEWDGNMDGLPSQPWVPEHARPHLEKFLEDHRAAVTRADYLRGFFESNDKTAALMKDLETTRSELDTLKQTFAKAEQELGTYRAQAEEAAADKYVSEMRGKYPDIFDEAHYDAEKDTGPWATFFELLKTYPEDKAARMTRALLPEKEVAAPAAQPAAATPAAPPAPPKTREVVVPASVKAMSKGSNSPSVTQDARQDHMTFDQKVAEMERAIRAGAR